MGLWNDVCVYRCHVKSWYSYCWWFRNPAITSWYGKYPHYFFNGFHTCWVVFSPDFWLPSTLSHTFQDFEDGIMESESRWFLRILVPNKFVKISWWLLVTWGSWMRGNYFCIHRLWTGLMRQARTVEVAKFCGLSFGWTRIIFLSFLRDLLTPFQLQKCRHRQFSMRKAMGFSGEAQKLLVAWNQVKPQRDGRCRWVHPGGVFFWGMKFPTQLYRDYDIYNKPI